MNAVAAKTEKTRLNQGFTIALVATVLWSSTAIFIRYLTETYRMPPLALAFWRDVFVSATLALAFLIIRPRLLRVERRHLLFLGVYGLVLSLFNSLWTASVSLNGAAVSTVLAYSSAAFTAILGRWLFKERLDGVKIAAVSLSLLGCALVAGAFSLAAWRLNPVGIVTGLLSGIGFAGYSLMGKSSSIRGINPWSALLYAFAGAAVFIFLYNLFPGWRAPGSLLENIFWLKGELAGWLVLIALAAGPSIGGYGLYTVSLTYLPASVANLIATLEPAMTAMLAYALLGERLTLAQLAGSAMIILGVILLRLQERNGGVVPVG